MQPPKTLAVAGETTKSPGGFGLEAELGREAVKGDVAAITAVTPTKGSFGLDAEAGDDKMPLKVKPHPLRRPSSPPPQSHCAADAARTLQRFPRLRHGWSHQLVRAGDDGAR